jgi:hypothetical protein
MRLRYRTLLGLLTTLACTWAVVGCGGGSDKTLTVRGKVIDKDGKDLIPTEKQLIQVAFHPVRKSKDQSPSKEANLDESGNFKVELPPGKYKITIQIFEQKTNPGPRVLSNPKEDYAHGDRTPFVRTFESRVDDFVIDLRKKTG